MNNLIVEKNQLGRDFIIGDLHGCFSLLQVKLKDVDFNPEFDRLFSVGDLIDRGENSLACLELIRQPWFYAVRGNHEQFILDSILGEGKDSDWYYNGGQWAFKLNEEGIQYLKSERLLDLARELDLSIPLTLTLKTEFGNIGICHAEPPSNNWEDVLSLDKGLIYNLLWNRNLIEEVDSNPIQNIDLTIHGHTPVKEITKVSNSLFIDTGAFFTDNLTLLRIDNILSQK